MFDYQSPTCGADIKKLTQNKLRYAWSCASGGEKLCATALSDVEPSKYGFISEADGKLLKDTNPLVDGPLYILAYDITNEPYFFPQTGYVQPSGKEMEFAQTFKELSTELLRRQVIRPVNMSVNRGGSGLEGVMKGMDEMEHSKVSGVKLVYTL